MAAYRAAKHESAGYLPNFLIFGREARAPIDLVLRPPPVDEETFSSADEIVAQMQRMQRESYALAREHLGAAAEQRKDAYDIKTKPARFQVGIWVWYLYPRRYVGRSPKWNKCYQGPYSSQEQCHHVTTSSRELEKGNHSSSTAINSSPTTAKHPHPGCRKPQQNSQQVWFPMPTTQLTHLRTIMSSRPRLRCLANVTINLSTTSTTKSGDASAAALLTWAIINCNRPPRRDPVCAVHNIRPPFPWIPRNVVGWKRILPSSPLTRTTFKAPHSCSSFDLILS